MIERPDLTHLPPEVVAYIEALEAEVAEARAADDDAARNEPPLEPSEPPTSMNLITISAAGFAKRTPRHHYLRQRRGGMGVFDLDSGENDPSAFLVIAEASAGLILVTNQARAFRVAVND